MPSVEWDSPLESTVLDVAAAIIERSEQPIDHVKLQKLLYLVQAAHLAWFDEPAFTERIEAWVWGPVVPRVGGHYMQFGPQTITRATSGSQRYLSTRQIRVIDEVLAEYSPIGGFDLAALVKKEDMPWPRIREGMPPDQYSDEEIPLALIRSYHRKHGLPRQTEATPEEQSLARRVFAGDREAFKELAQLNSAHETDSG